MGKKYTAADYQRMAENYAAKAKELQLQEEAALGEIFLRTVGKYTPEEAENFLRQAVNNNQQNHWYQPVQSTSSDTKDQFNPGDENTPRNVTGSDGDPDSAQDTDGVWPF